MIKAWHETAWADYEYWQAHDKKVLNNENQEKTLEILRRRI